MSKVAAYLQEHIAGEISVQPAVLSALSHDRSVLEIRPEMVVYPRTTNDIRKVARFSWQLAEKGHVLPITVRGGGNDETGAAIGRGVIISMIAHLNTMLEFDLKQKLIRLQPGMSAKGLNDALMLHGLSVPALPIGAPGSTVGGAVAGNSVGAFSGYGDMRTWVHQLEVVLANGDILQTERLSRRELDKRKGMQTFEGEIYRTLDNLIEDNRQIIEEKIGVNTADNSGYSAIAKVKQKDGSFDLTPLIIGSQGTLGIVSEMIIKAEFASMHAGVLAAVFGSKEQARDALDSLKQLEPVMLEYFDGRLFEIAAAKGKQYNFIKDLPDGIGAVVVIGFNDFSERARKKKLKRAEKLISQAGAAYEMAEDDEAPQLLSVREITSFALMPDETGASAPPLMDGAYIPPERFEDFSRAVMDLAGKQHVELPLHVDALTNFVYTRPVLHFNKVGDRQKIFKLLDAYTSLVSYHGGCLIGEGGEGRLKARFAQAQLDEDIKALYTAIKTTFDPYGILNPGVKQPAEVRQLVAQLRKEYDLSTAAGYISYR